MGWITWVIVAVVAVISVSVAFFLGISYRKKIAEKEIISAEEQAKKIINDAIKASENKKREILIEAKEEIHKNHVQPYNGTKARRIEVQKQERRNQQ